MTMGPVDELGDPAPGWYVRARRKARMVHFKSRYWELRLAIRSMPRCPDRSPHRRLLK